MSGITVQQLQQRVREFVSVRSWEKYHKPKEIAVALSVEAAELLEIFLWTDAERPLSVEETERVRRETADVAIYALSMASACGFDLGEAIAEKIELNEGKYPAEESEGLFDQ